LAGRSGSGRIGCGHAGMWPTVHRPARCKRRSPRCSIKCPRGNDGATRHRRRRVPRLSGGWSTRCAYVGFLGLLGSEDARTAGGRCARPSPAWARRRRGDGAGNLTRAGRGGAKGDGVRGGVHPRQATHAGAQGWGRDGVSWRRSRRSPTRRQGWRRARRTWLVGANATGCTVRCSARPTPRRSFLWRPCARLTRP
jgi:hypothetical protein